jgi:hypothetical protein
MNNTLDKIIDGSLPSVNIEDSLDMVSYKDREATLQNIIKKIMYGGFIELTGVDLEEVSRAINQGYISEDEGNSLLYGNSNSLSVSSLDSVCGLISKYGFKVFQQRRNKYRYYIKAKRSEPRE